MKIEIDTKRKKIKVIGEVDHQSLMEILKKGLPKSWNNVEVSINELNKNKDIQAIKST